MQGTTPETVGFRLSPQQEYLLALEDGLGAATLVALLAPGVDAAAFERALYGAAEQHEILRTTFSRPAGMRTPQQVIGGRLELTVSAGEQPAGADPAELAAGQLAEPFDHERGPLLRASLVERADGAALVLSASPACADATSLLTLLEEACAAYAGSPGATEPVQYADYAQWRHELAAEGEPAAQKGRAFWLEALEERGSPPRILFAQDPAPGPIAGSSVPVDFGSIDLRELRQAATGAGVSPAVFLQAAWHVLLSRLSAEPDLQLAGWLDGRAQPDLAGAVGPYSQPAPFHTRLRDATTFAEVLDQVRRARAAAERWQDFATAADLAAAGERVAGFSHLELGELPAAVAELVLITPAPAPIGLLLDVRIGQHAIGGHVRYDLRIHDARDAQELASRLPTLLAAAVNDPACPVSRLRLIDEAERERLIAAAGGGAAPGAAPASSTPVHRQFEAQVARTPDAIAVRSANGQLSYDELNQAANRLAHHLRGLGASPGETIGLCMERTPSMLVALLAILKAGSAYLPLNYEHPAARMAHQLAQCGSHLVVTEDHLADRLPEFGGAVIRVDADAQAIAACPGVDPGGEADPDQPAYVIYTSGSTGMPKGVAVLHRNLSAYLASIVERLAEGDPARFEGWRFGVVSAISTDLGNTTLFTPLLCGGCVQLVSAAASMDPDAFAAELGGEPLDVLKITPSHLRALLAGERPEVLPRRLLVLGGEALGWELAAAISQRAPACAVVNHYGPTETTVGCCTYTVDGARPDSRTVPIGFPLPAARTYVLDAHLEPVPAGVPGELYVGGDGVARGYLDPEAGGDGKFLADPFAGEREVRVYRTGDRVRRLRDGALEFLGRIDGQVKIRGFRIEPGEIEARLASHPAISAAAVSAEDDGHGGLRLVAYIVSDPPPALDELEEFLGEVLPDYMVPQTFATIEALPYTPSGKLDRRALSTLAEVQTRRAADYVAPRDEVEEQIAEIWCELLDVPRVGVLDDFFALGGHSLLATQVIMRIRRVYGDVPLRALLAAPTVAGLAEAVREGAAEPR